MAARVGAPVEGAVGEDRVVEETQPLLHGAVRGDDEARAAVAPDDELVEVDGLLRGEAMEHEVVENEQVGHEEAAGNLLGGAVDAGLHHLAEVVVGQAEAVAVFGASGCVAEGLGPFVGSRTRPSVPPEWLRGRLS